MNKSTKYICDCVIAGGCDLHMHTTYSDGADSVVELVQKVLENKLQCFSVTDHDSIDAIPKVLSLLQKLDELGFKTPEFIPGIEISAEHGCEIHILGYFPHGGYEKMQDFVLVQRDRRNKRNEKMCESLTKMGMPISIEELNAEGEKSIGRLHAANVLIRKGYILNASQGFNDVFGYGKPCYVKREKPKANEAIDAIRNAGGVPVLAHPFLYGWTGAVPNRVSKKLIDSIFELKALGLQGIEVFHGESSHMQREEIFAASIVSDLFPSAGSDYHGVNKENVQMYTGSKRFLDEQICAQAVAIIKIGKKFLVEKRSRLEDCDKGIRFPGLDEHLLRGDSIGGALQKYVWEHISPKLKIKEHYLTTYAYGGDKREILSAFLFERHESTKLMDEILSHQKTGSISRYKLMDLQEIASRIILKSHAEIVSKLREISLFD